MKIVECFLCLLAVIPANLGRLPIEYKNHTWESSSRLRRQLGSESYNCGISYHPASPLMMGGEIVSHGEYPWLVALFLNLPNGPSFRCGASLVSKQHVLTAAHCTYTKNRNDFLLKLGMHNMQDWVDKNVKLATIENIQYHPEFEPSKVLQRDIAILVMENPIEYSQYIIPVCLWEGNDDLSNIVGRNGTVVGWGKDENRSTIAPEPRKVTIPVVSTETCRGSRIEFYPLTNNMTICAGNRNMTGPCNGDSGGGLYIKMNGRWMIRGIVSTSLQGENGETCNLSEYIIFTDAAKYNPWIKEVIDVCKSTSCDLSDCKLPERPISGSYSVLDVFSISLQPGDTVPEQTVLQYSCDDGTINNRTVTVCAKGSWNHKIECRSPFLTSHVTTTDALPTNLTSPHTEGFSTTTPSMVSLKGTKHCYIRCEGKQHKWDVVRKICGLSNVIFSSDVERVREIMKGREYPPLVIHEDMPTTQIDNTLQQQFYGGDYLVASPSLATRVDMERVNVCINYEVPTVEGYRHTVARRYFVGTPPVTISLVSGDELEVVRRIQLRYGIHMDEIPRRGNIRQAVEDYRDFSQYHYLKI